MVGSKLDLSEYTSQIDSDFKHLRPIVNGHVVYYYQAQLMVHMVTQRLK